MREARGLTQEELAERAGLSRKAISVLERGERKRPYAHTVRSLAGALGLSEDEHASLLAAVPRRGASSSLSSSSAAAAPATNPKPSLPALPTPLLGRERELAEIESFLHKVRLLTLTGTGGVGKTRLAIEAAREGQGSFPDGVHFVGLASLNDSALVLPTVAHLITCSGEARAAAVRYASLQARSPCRPIAGGLWYRPTPEEELRRTRPRPWRLGRFVRHAP